MSNQANAVQGGKNAATELFLLSACALYLELLVIRWLSADFMAFSVFKTFPLVTCYIGLGLGFAATSASSEKYFRLTPFALLLFLVIMRAIEFFSYSAGYDFSKWVFPSLGVYQWFHFDVMGSNLWAYILAFILILLFLLNGPFAVMACLGSRLGNLFSQFKPLTAYGINLLGSMAGSILFSVLAFTGAAPWLLLVAPLLCICFYVQEALWKRLIPFVASIALAFWVPNLEPGHTIYWSPYQKLSVADMLLPLAGKSQDQGSSPWQKNQGIVIGSNGQFYQFALNLSQSNITSPELTQEARKLLQEHANQYNLPYKLIKPKSVLILGAGSGNDVASALRHEVEHIDAVDIDRVILDLGARRHPERPYDSPKVSVYCDDARDFLNKCKSKYDLIIFAGLDSHTVTGKGASVRLDNFVYTKESIQHTLSLLNPDGLIFLSFCKSTPWLSRRLFETIHEAAGYPPMVLLDMSKPRLQWEIFVAGKPVQERRLTPSSAIDPFAIQEPAPAQYAHILTDDWPFIYVTPIGVDLPYLLVLASVLALAAVASRKLLFSKEAQLWQLFFLGSAFILLELQAIARLSLLYGSTWMTASIVINCVLLMIFAANYLVDKAGDRLSGRQPLLYAILFATLLFSYLLPVRVLLDLPGYSGHALITLLTVLPMFMAGIVFPTAFRQAADPRRAYAFNLLGAVLGSLLEYLSNFIGINSLVLVALALYAISLACLQLKKKH